MKGPTEVRKGDLKRAGILVFMCLTLAFLLYSNWLKTARGRSAEMKQRVAEAQRSLNELTRATEELGQVKDKTDVLEEAVDGVVELFPPQNGLTGRLGGEVVERAEQNSVSLLSVDNSDPEQFSGSLYGTEFEILIRGEYINILNFIELMESRFYRKVSRLKFTVEEEGSVKAVITLLVYGADV